MDTHTQSLKDLFEDSPSLKAIAQEKLS